MSTHHTFIVDTSYSMYDTLPLMKQHLKNNLATTIKEKDTLTLIFFSGESQCGTIVSHHQVSDLEQLSLLQDTIDRYLIPRTCTSFTPPLQLAIKNIQENQIKSTEKSNQSLLFMTDGYHNQGSEITLLETCRLLPQYFNKIKFIEYGWDCNRALLERMTNSSQGEHDFVEDFESLIECTQQNFQQNLHYYDNIKDKNYTKVVYIDNENHKVQIFRRNETKNGIYLPKENLTFQEGSNQQYIFAYDCHLAPLHIGDEIKYSLLYALVEDNKIEEAEQYMLTELKDKALYMKLINAFTKQNLSDLLQDIESACFDVSKRFENGEINADNQTELELLRNPFTLLQLLNLLTKNDTADEDTNKNYLHYNHDAFQYSRTSMASLKANSENPDKKIKTSEHKIVFQETGEGKAKLNSLVFHSTRANVNLNVQKPGFVTLPAEKAKEYGLDEEYVTSSHKSYTIIRDGIIHVKKLPVSLDQETYKTLVEKCPGIFGDSLQTKTRYSPTRVYILYLTNLPLINRNDMKKYSHEDEKKNYLKDVFDQFILKAEAKVMKYLLDKEAGREESKEENSVTDKQDKQNDQTTYLKSIGIYGDSFSPHGSKSKKDSVDSYEALTLEVKIKGLSSLPAISKVEQGKGTGLSGKLIQRILKKYQTQNLGEKQETWKQICDQRTELDAKCHLALYVFITTGIWELNKQVQLDLKSGDIETTATGNLKQIQIAL